MLLKSNLDTGYRVTDHEERLRIMALALRKGLPIQGEEAVSILEEAADFIEFMFDSLEDIVEPTHEADPKEEE